LGGDAMVRATAAPGGADSGDACAELSGWRSSLISPDPADLATRNVTFGSTVLGRALPLFEQRVLLGSFG
jgi:hypothetical protein